ncbi:Beta-hexosaminidase [Cladobotryum mycophilum]|uniref:Beta-hexosaminidase n=1 Tax=Cladobotryum mycophilum TaxID=491253 RepID=A0ABR0SHA2_9HYPO
MLHRAVFALVAAAVAFTPVNALWPVPKHSSTGNKVLFIDQAVEVTYNGQSVRWTPPPHSNSPLADRGDGEHLAETEIINQQVSYTAGYVPPGGPKFNSKEIIQSGVSRTFGAIFQQGFVPWMLRERGSDYEPTLGGANSTRIKTLKIVQTKEDDENTFKPKVGTVDESYTLNVTVTGHASIQAVSSTGVLRALETFSQLFFKHSSGTAWYTSNAPVAINDAPKFPHRGLLLDVGRHWFEVSDIKRTIDALAMNKMNVLHLHITETQSWPLEIPSLPLLAEKGAYHKGLTYSPQDIAGIQEYGVHRGVQVVLEIDMPGHVGVENAYPGVSVAYNAHPWQWYCAQPPCGSFRLNNTDTEKFIDKLFEDLLPRLSPYTTYFHTGGDEYKANNSLLDPALKTNNMQVLQPLLQRFIDHAHGKVRELGLTPLVWEEMVLDWNATLGKDVIVQTWLGKGAIQKLAEKGHKVIDSSNDFYYLDCGRGEWLDSPNGEAFDNSYPFPDWCSPTKNWRLMYSHEPTDGVSAEAAKNILGGEVCLWTETVDTTSLDSILWPRAAAAAEIWWSGKTDAKGANRSQVDARPRLSEQRERMLARGVRGTPITQLWCDQVDVENCVNGIV